METRLLRCRPHTWWWIRLTLDDWWHDALEYWPLMAGAVAGLITWAVIR